MVNVEKMSKKRIDNLIYDLEEWMCLVGREEDWLTHEDDNIEEIFGSKGNYLEELIEWVSAHVCKEDGRDPKWWESHGFTKSEAKWLAE